MSREGLRGHWSGLFRRPPREVIREPIVSVPAVEVNMGVPVVTATTVAYQPGYFQPAVPVQQQTLVQPSIGCRCIII